MFLSLYLNANTKGRDKPRPYAIINEIKIFVLRMLRRDNWAERHVEKTAPNERGGCIFYETMKRYSGGASRSQRHVAVKL